MEMQMEFIRKLPIPAEVKKQFPLDDHLKTIKERNDQEIIDILTGKSNKLLLIIGPCSADNEDAVLEYMHRLRKVAKVEEAPKRNPKANKIIKNLLYFRIKWYIEIESFWLSLAEEILISGIVKRSVNKNIAPIAWAIANTDGFSKSMNCPNRTAETA